MFVVTVVVKTLMWAEAVVNMLVEELTIGVVIEELTGLMADVGVDMVDVEIIVVTAVVAAVAIGLDFAAPPFDVLIDALTDVLADVKVNVLVAATAVLEFVIPALLYEFTCCCAVFDCCSMALLNFACVLQARMPSYHVCPVLALPALPHCLNQEPL